MDTATRDRNIATWLGDAPQPVRDTTNQLLERIALLRAEQTIYPAQDDIPQCPLLHAGRPGQGCHLGSRPLSRTQPGYGAVRSRSPRRKPSLPPSLRNIYKELNADLGYPIPATGDLTPWAQQGVLLLNTTLTVREHAANSHAKLGWSTLTDYVIERCCQLSQPVVFLAWGRFAQQMVEGKLVATGTGKATDKFCLASTHPSPLSANRATAELPAFMGVAPLLRCQSTTRTARLDPRQLDLPRLKSIHQKRARRQSCHRARFLLGPDKLCAASLATVNEQALSGHKPVGHAHKVDPLGDLWAVAQRLSGVSSII